MPPWARTSPKVVDAFYKSRSNLGLAFFRLDNRWSATATDGGGLQRGDPTTLTWSFIPDGTSIPGGNQGAGEAASGSNLRAFLNGIYGSQAVWQAVFQQVFDRWSQLTGLKSL